MTARDAIKILILSPVYFRLDLKARKNLVQEFLELHGECFQQSLSFDSK